MGCALGLARCGFGDELLHAASTMDESGFAVFISSWRARLSNQLLTNSLGHLPSKRPSTVQESSFSSFPDPTILRYYVNPVTSETVPPGTTDMHWDWNKNVNWEALGTICRSCFRWSSDQTTDKLSRGFLQGIVIRAIRAKLLRMDGEPPCTILLHFPVPPCKAIY